MASAHVPIAWSPPVRDDGSLRVIDGTDRTVLVTSYPALIQAAGYLKYIARGTHYVVYRGQSRAHDSLVPSLFRGVKLGTARDRMGRLRSKVAEYHGRREFLSGTPSWAHAPLLQHYGIRTPWLDLVDNYWVALWFAIHDLTATGADGRFISIRQRSTTSSGPIVVGTESFTEPLGFIQVIAIPQLAADPTRPGVWTNDAYEIIDLRVAAPSLYIRPHAQHGLLVRRSKLSDIGDLDLQELVGCTLAVPVALASQWVGGLSLEHRSIFPSPHDDPGYHKLLRTTLSDVVLGGVTWVGY